MGGVLGVCDESYLEIILKKRLDIVRHICYNIDILKERSIYHDRERAARHKDGYTL